MKCPNCQFDNTEDSAFCRKCGTQFPYSRDIQFSKTMTLDTATKIMSAGSLFAGRYKVLGILGQGGMGIVYKADDTKLKRTVALKFLPAELSRFPEARERFMREAQAAAVLDHPNICTVHEVEEAEGVTYIAMAYVEGESLREKIAKAPLGIEQAANITLQVAEGLEAAHKKGIVHRDIKSGNIMVREDGQVRIMDFGLAKVAGESALTRDAKTMGTVAYMSPEQARGEETDQRTDVWSLGVVLYEMLTGELPFRGERETAIMYAIVHEEPKPLQKLKPGIPIEISKIVEKALKKERNSRYASAAELAADLRKYQESVRSEAAGIFSVRSLLRRLRKPQVAIPAALALIAIVALAFWFFNRQAKIRWATNEALPEINRLAFEGDYSGAWGLASRAEEYISNDPALVKAWPTFSRTVSIHTDPPGAMIDLQRYRPTDQEWHYQGQTPVDNLRVPRGRYRMKIRLDGYVDLECAFPTADRTFDFTLFSEGQFPAGMVMVPGGEYQLFIPGLDHLNAVKLGDYLIDKFEVTNRDFAEFIRGGCYKKSEYWKVPFIKDGEVVPWDQAMKEFNDQTGRPGPATWEAGDYPRGKEVFPVHGISWYEAAAYAEYSGKSLPTVFHWSATASPMWSADIIPLGNYSGLGPTAVGQKAGMSTCGAYDMAGNVREWCWNSAGENKHYILGGGWNDPGYAFLDAYAQSAWDRSQTNGFRCMKYLKEEATLAELERPVERMRRDFRTEKPVSDEVFSAFRRMYAYDKTEVNPRIEAEDKSHPDWTKQKISFDAAYGQERVLAVLYLPKSTPPPFQAVIYFPGSHAIHLRTAEAMDQFSMDVDFILKNGRAVLFPMFKGTFERGDDLISDYPAETAFYRDHVIMWAKDLARSIDYLENRDDIAIDKIAYYGFSWGGVLGAILPAIEERIKLVILYVAGLCHTRAFPEADQINFLPRVKVPVLMLNGQYDFFFPVDSSQKPMFELLGTPPEFKQLIIYPSSHFVPRIELIKEVLNWLDKYFGPAK